MKLDLLDLFEQRRSAELSCGARKYESSTRTDAKYVPKDASYTFLFYLRCILYVFTFCSKNSKTNGRIKSTLNTGAPAHLGAPKACGNSLDHRLEHTHRDTAVTQTGVQAEKGHVLHKLQQQQQNEAVTETKVENESKRRRRRKRIHYKVICNRCAPFVVVVAAAEDRRQRLRTALDSRGRKTSSSSSSAIYHPT